VALLRVIIKRNSLTVCGDIDLEIRLRPIGFVRSKFTKDRGDARKIISEIVLFEELGEALTGIEGYSHLLVLFWMDKIRRGGRRIREMHPWGKEELPLVGVFATRAPLRPNPIGLAPVELVERCDNILRVRGLDAWDGTPVIDIKPYDHWDRIDGIRVPEWWTKTKPKIRK